MKLKTKKILLKCGIRANLSGFEYLGEAIELVLEDRRKLQGITKCLYPEIAKRHNTKVNNIERGIRHAIESAFDIISPDDIIEIYGNSLDFRRGKPTNSQFIATVVQLFGDEIISDSNENK